MKLVGLKTILSGLMSGAKLSFADLPPRDDPIVPLANVRVLATLIPNARLAVLENGHPFAVARVDEGARAMNEFLAAEAA